MLRANWNYVLGTFVGYSCQSSHKENITRFFSSEISFFITRDKRNIIEHISTTSALVLNINKKRMPVLSTGFKYMRFNDTLRFLR